MTNVAVSDHMIVSAVRYALGRSTYIVGWTVDEVIRILDALPATAQTLIARDVGDALSNEWPPMMEMDRDEWVRLIEFTEAQRD